jgi:alanine racemase
MKNKIQFEGRPIWAEISIRALLHNLRIIRRNVGRERKILAIVKANAYGLGAVPIAKALERAGTEWFGVTCTSEAIELREAGIRLPILLLTGFWPGEERRMLKYRLTPTVTRVEQLRPLERAVGQYRGAGRTTTLTFHLKIDSGMNRLGINPSDIDWFARTLGSCPHLRLGGTYTHFASAENFTSEQTPAQETVFLAAIERLRGNGVSPGIVHLSNSGAICARPSTWADMVRPGAILYGYHQSFAPEEMKTEMMKRLPFRPTVALRTRVIALRNVPEGAAVGYGATFVAKRPTRIAVVAAGYADGLVRHRSNRGSVLLRGQAVPLVGIISMDLSMLDVTTVPKAAIGDVVTIYGRDGERAMEVSDVAREVGSVTSDLLCALGRRVPRFYIS